MRYQVKERCKARDATGRVVNIDVGTYAVPGEESASLSVRLVADTGEIEISRAEFQRLKSAGLLTPV